MIELIFIIVIIGILAIIAIPKLNATRDDAKTVVELNNITNCINDIASSYTSNRKEDNNTISCKSIKCAIISLGNLKDGNITVAFKSSPKYCTYTKKKAEDKRLEGMHSFSSIKLNLN